MDTYSEVSHKKRNIVIAAIALVLIACLVIFLLWPGGYTDIRLLEVFGQVTYDRESDKDIPVYDDMRLVGGDTMKTGENESFARMKLDDSKFVFMEENSLVNFDISGRKNNSKILLNLEYGSIINEIEKPLKNSESYEVKTPNALMAVRGTRFRVSCYTDDNGVFYTRISGLEGKVECSKVLPDGTVSTESQMAETGNEAVIFYDENNDMTEFLLFDENGDPLPIGVNGGEALRDLRIHELSKQALYYFNERIKEGTDYPSISRDSLNEAISEKTGISVDTIVATQNVPEGETEPVKEDPALPVVPEDGLNKDAEKKDEKQGENKTVNSDKNKTEPKPENQTPAPVDPTKPAETPANPAASVIQQNPTNPATQQNLINPVLPQNPTVNTTDTNDSVTPSKPSTGGSLDDVDVPVPPINRPDDSPSTPGYTPSNPGGDNSDSGNNLTPPFVTPSNPEDIPTQPETPDDPETPEDDETNGKYATTIKEAMERLARYPGNSNVYLKTKESGEIDLDENSNNYADGIRLILIDSGDITIKSTQNNVELWIGSIEETFNGNIIGGDIVSSKNIFINSVNPINLNTLTFIDRGGITNNPGSLHSTFNIANGLTLRNGGHLQDTTVNLNGGQSVIGSGSGVVETLINVNKNATLLLTSGTTFKNVGINLNGGMLSIGPDSSNDDIRFDGVSSQDVSGDYSRVRLTSGIISSVPGEEIYASNTEITPPEDDMIIFKLEPSISTYQDDGFYYVYSKTDGYGTITRHINDYANNYNLVSSAPDALKLLSTGIPMVEINPGVRALDFYDSPLTANNFKENQTIRIINPDVSINLEGCNIKGKIEIYDKENDRVNYNDSVTLSGDFNVLDGGGLKGKFDITGNLTVEDMLPEAELTIKNGGSITIKNQTALKDLYMQDIEGALLDEFEYVLVTQFCRFKYFNDGYFMSEEFVSDNLIFEKQADGSPRHFYFVPDDGVVNYSNDFDMEYVPGYITTIRPESSIGIIPRTEG